MTTTASSGRDERALLDSLQEFVRELRAAGLPVSTTENLDAARAAACVDLADREVFRASLGATLVKHARHRPVFDTLFDIYFSTGRGGADRPDDDASAVDAAATPEDGGPLVSPDDLVSLMAEALARDDDAALARLVAAAVSHFAGMTSGRPVGGTYYIYRTLRALDLDALGQRVADLLGASLDDVGDDDALAARLARDEVDVRIQLVRRLVEEEIRRRLVEDRGAEAMVRSLRRPLPEDVDFVHATREDTLALQQVVYPLTRALAARLAQRRRRRRHGTLDFRRTVRASLSTGGVPVEPRFRRPHPSKPEIMVLADISGSVANFARFTLLFVYAMASQFSRVRSWAFVDGIDEVTRFFDHALDVGESVRRVTSEADVVWTDGHSDYGHALTTFFERHGREVSPKTTIIVLGDARNNYHSTEAWVIDQLVRRARAVHWLNPEPRAYWNTGDSVMQAYAERCTGVYECRNLRQLQRFVARVADAA